MSGALQVEKTETAIAANGRVDRNVRPARFVAVQTVHSGFVGWWWTRERLHDNGYNIKVNDAVRAAVREAERRYGVRENTQLRCQWEGVEVEGDNLPAVTQAANDIAAVLARFRGVVPLDFERA